MLLIVLITFGSYFFLYLMYTIPVEIYAYHLLNKYLIWIWLHAPTKLYVINISTKRMLCSYKPNRSRSDCAVKLMFYVFSTLATIVFFMSVLCGLICHIWSPHMSQYFVWSHMPQFFGSPVLHPTDLYSKYCFIISVTYFPRILFLEPLVTLLVAILQFSSFVILQPASPSFCGERNLSLIVKHLKFF